jgi:DNA replication initiation complex subunit (GINS family)
MPNEIRANEAEILRELAFRRSLTPDERELYNKLQFEDTIARMRQNAIDTQANEAYWKQEIQFRKSLIPDEKQLYNKMQIEEKIKEMRVNETKNKAKFDFS